MRTSTPSRLSLSLVLALAVALGACSGESGSTSAVEGTTAPPSKAAEAPDPDDAAAGVESAATVTPATAAPAAAPAATGPADPAAVLHPSEIQEERDIPDRPIGKDPGESIFAEYFEKHPELKPDDPEADSVRRGRRLVGPIDAELEKSFDTPEDLASAYLDAIFLESLEILDEIRVNEEEHATIFWPEFPESRPITNATAGEAWRYHQGHCHEGVIASLDRWGGVRLRLLRVRFDGGVARYRNFNLYHDVVIEAQDPDGNIVELPWAKTFAERNGRWKIYTYHD